MIIGVILLHVNNDYFYNINKFFLVIEEANWLTLYDDIKHIIGDGFDAVICLGNSFAHMMDSFGDQREQKQAIKNFEKCVKLNGLLLIDHRNYDHIMSSGATPAKCIYYNVCFNRILRMNNFLTYQN